MALVSTKTGKGPWRLMDGRALERSDSDQVSNIALDILECCRAVPVGSLRTGCRIRGIEMPVDAVVESARRWRSLSGLVEGWWVSCHSGDGKGWAISTPRLDSKLISGLGRAADALDVRQASLYANRGSSQPETCGGSRFAFFHAVS